jgi:hypothetical protein
MYGLVLSSDEVSLDSAMPSERSIMTLQERHHPVGDDRITFHLHPQAQRPPLGGLTRDVRTASYPRRRHLVRDHLSSGAGSRWVDGTW